MKLSESLDKVFDYLNNDKDDPERIEHIQGALSHLKLIIGLRDLLQILDKLCKEGLVSYKKGHKDKLPEIKFYYITFDGIELIEKRKSYSQYVFYKYWLGIWNRFTILFEKTLLVILGFVLANLDGCPSNASKQDILQNQETHQAKYPAETAKNQKPLNTNSKNDSLK